MNPDTDTDTDMTELLDDLDADDADSELGDNLRTTLDVLAEEIDVSTEGGGGMNGGMMDPGMALSVLKPLLQRWADENPDEVKAALARVHLETGALLDHHEPDAEPMDLLDHE